ncbi:trifunctional transcriptional regulator/proline dehydrogenase/L-glutamate gamma-semialdehyde dehydrogenase [Acerihabitans sp. TG2]|uniref:trifunctional transcriptional regulator/proline dehydrogenase/L-glutamate gamma-semialdehyde dehydrogenase n=1 Tax=Acerihabitans sp. TG2 TaxID=3096008 RepID=UPI002B227C74|nr:trifunctional transcriptional regulator/proline dehydrogenase/L-glutamate gamma-semialdehyde dehydrogenase [Acerihabitans sp. TG2]MEA9392572.1 trifunctional transcriptional regulator/proline dehydrogenase/L-glutamate gamma-semialdehyde dehydrogenase [Acerihabitans sp. TG2]
MATTTMGVKLDDAARERIKLAASRLDRTPHWLIKHAIFLYLDTLENDAASATVESLPVDDTDEVQTRLSSPADPPQPFLDLAWQILPQSVLRAATTAAWRRPESDIIPLLVTQARPSPSLDQPINALALRLAQGLRQQKIQGGRAGMVQGFLQEFSLSSQEGVALMCLAEALLRVPDKPTRDILIRDKISQGDWQRHLGRSRSVFVNAATWGLLFTGRLVSTHNQTNLSHSLNRIIGKRGEPLIRRGVDMAMRLMGEQFVTGENMGQALANAHRLEQQGFRYSYDMLGEAALTEQDAQAYFVSYQQAIHAIGKASNGRGIYEGPGISIKLSALHPRYCRAQYGRVMDELYPRLLALTQLARHYDIGLNIDAEEADRLELSLDLLTKLCFEPDLAGWNGIGFVIQAYQKRCPWVIDELVDLAQRSRHRLMIRLVKGAYWDSEIKRAQVDGLEGYPVYTRKVYTDVAYLACARKLLAVPHLIYPQFATHNAQTLAAIYYFAGENYYPGQYEFQCLHGMGEPLYHQVVGATSAGKLNRPCRIYAPVGSHQTLLAYLVRRLLENGANTSFVNRIADANLSLETLITDPVAQALALGEQEGQLGRPHPKIPLPRQLYGSSRLNPAGIDLANEQRLASLSTALLNHGAQSFHAGPISDDPSHDAPPQDGTHQILNPADSRDRVGVCRDADTTDVQHALASAAANGELWSATPPLQRATILCRAAELFEQQMPLLISLLIREAGKSLTNAIAEGREAADFLRYYAGQIQYFEQEDCRALGPVVCISPWNFPLAIFTGQVAAALAAGNAVLAKPAEQTPLVAAQAVRLLLAAGVPAGVLHLLPGAGETVGATLVADARVRGVMFTGSTAVARLLQASLSTRLDPDGRPVPLIAETGGLNAMIVDSSALTEQVVNDVIASAFDSAGQRCSALRLLCLQDDVADHTLHMLRGAMEQYQLGDPQYLSTDIGPVIDADAALSITAHIAAMGLAGHRVWQPTTAQATAQALSAFGTFIPPTLIELDDVAQLTQEVFGPVLHVVRYQGRDLPALLTHINASGYGLTLGLHTRIDETINQVIAHAKVGNCYINRNIVGAVVGVQPFGGEGLSGTGPKAGGPLYLYRLLSRRRCDQQLAALRALDAGRETAGAPRPLPPAHQALIAWAQTRRPAEQLALWQRFGALSEAGTVRPLIGPTGEQNTYRLLPKERVLCLADEEHDLLNQLAAATSQGSTVLWTDTPVTRALLPTLPPAVQQQIAINTDWLAADRPIDAVLFHGDADRLLSLCSQLARRPGPLVQVQGYTRGDTAILLESLLIERAVSINTAAAGGNASLMTLG